MRELPRRLLERRKYVFIALLFLSFLFLLGGFTKLQLYNTEFYLQKSINNSIRSIEIYPVRGLIKDRNGNILVDNRPSFALSVIPKTVSTQTLSYVIHHLDLDSATVYKRINQNFGFRPVIIARDLLPRDVVDFEERRLEFPGVLTIVEPKRYYMPGVNSPHIFGSIGEVTQVEQLLSPIYKQGDIVGKSGLEKKYDLSLRGTKGLEYKRIDASGKDLGYYDENRNIPPIHGNDLYLYMDYKMQCFAESLFTGRQGALVALDTRNGGVLALVSKPDFDPRSLSGRINPEIWSKLINDPHHPLYSRAIQSTYPPGSTYKLVAALAALQEKIITPHWHAYCPGYYKLGRRIIHCWKVKGHGNIDLLQAIKGSCNVYFYQLGLKIGLDVWTRYSKKFGFGSLTGIDIPNEKPGLVPSIDYFNKLYGEHGWTRGNLANLAIGQGELLVTPLQMAQFAMILANRGIYYKPHLVDHVYDYVDKKMIHFPAAVKYIQGVSEKNYDVVREGMREVVNGGTGWQAKVRGIEMGGKTGTSQNPHGEPHAWFIGFAPFDKPEVAIAVIVENAGSGGGVAAPIARQFLEKYFYGKLLPRPIVKRDSTQAVEETEPLKLDNFNPIPITVPIDSL